MNFSVWGFWKEYTKNPHLPSILEEPTGQKPLADLDLIKGYLTKCPEVFSLRTLAFCERSKPQNIPIDSATFRSDGVWIWSDAIIFYLDKFKIIPPDKFLAHIRSRYHETVPPLSSEILLLASNEAESLFFNQKLA